MKKLSLYLFVCIVAASLTSCATILGGSKSKVQFANDKITQPVDITIDGKLYSNVSLPARLKVKGGFKPSHVTATSKGYEKTSVTVEKKFNSKTLWNIIWGGIPGMAIDAGTGAMMKPKYNSYFLDLKKETYADDPTIMAGEATNMVSRDNPGKTALEKIIIRWFFDSDPRGARIYWRVISSIPHIVKNTNETYLMTTPFESTRSFNILGLTYENSRDVQIEIKLSKRGYEDQIKRFNVRQAIDQQEISGFFEMVKKEEY